MDVLPVPAVDIVGPISPCWGRWAVAGGEVRRLLAEAVVVSGSVVVGEARVFGRLSAALGDALEGDGRLSAPAALGDVSEGDEWLSAATGAGGGAWTETCLVGWLSEVLSVVLRDASEAGCRLSVATGEVSTAAEVDAWGWLAVCRARPAGLLLAAWLFAAVLVPLAGRLRCSLSP